jgi:hypothetical protein
MNTEGEGIKRKRLSDRHAFVLHPSAFILLFSSCAVVFALALAANAQTPVVRAGVSTEPREQSLTTRWTTEDGLPQNSITSIVQTRDGYLWLGTFGGLVRFDGVRFTTLNTGNTPALKSNRITALIEDREGALWIGAETGDVTRYPTASSANTSTSKDCRATPFYSCARIQTAASGSSRQRARRL